MRATMFIADAHLDLSYNVFRGRDVMRPAAEQPPIDDEIATCGLPDLRAGGVGLICATIFCPPDTYKRRGYRSADEAYAMAHEQFRWYRTQFERGELRLVASPAELPSPQSQIANPKSQIPVILLLEGADAFRNPDDVADFFGLGLRIVGLAWRKTRMAGGTGAPGPLTADGQAVIRAMDELRMIHDASHLAEESFYQLLDLTAGPIIASHSNCRALVPGDRHLSDHMIRAIASRGGVIGVNFYDEFLLLPDQFKKRRCTLADLLAHIRHMCDLLGSAERVAIGSDLDGGVGRNDIPCELRTAADMPKVADALSAANFSEADVRNIMGENWLRFFRRSLPT